MTDYKNSKIIFFGIELMMEMTWIFQLSSEWIFFLQLLTIEIKSAYRAPLIDAEVLKAVRKKEGLRKQAKKSSSEYH